MNQLDELLKETEEAIYSNEYNTIEFHKVKNCTRATLDELQMMIEILKKEGNLQHYILSPEVKKIFKNCNIRTGRKDEE